MKYYCNLYLDDGLKEKKEEILDRLEKKQVQFQKYIVVLAKNTENHLEFFDSVILKQNIFEQDEMFVIGIADGYDGALAMVEKITQEVYNTTKDTDIRGYLLERQREYEEGIV